MLKKLALKLSHLPKPSKVVREHRALEILALCESIIFLFFSLTVPKMPVAFSLSRQPLSFFPFTMLKLVVFTSLMPSLAWLASVVVSPSSLLVCGSSPEATLLEAQVSSFFIRKSRCLIGVRPNQSSMMCGESSAGDIVHYVLVLTDRTDLGLIAFTSYGAFWMSYATILIPGSGIVAAYENTQGGAEQLSAALGIFLITWMIVTFLFLWVTELVRFCLLLMDI